MNKTKPIHMNIIVAITGASGAIYSRQVLDLLIASTEVEHVALIMSSHAEEVIQQEGVNLPDDPRIVTYSNDDMWSSVASGSARWDAMVVVPASMGTVARIASGVSRTLIERAADVMLKERRRLIVVVREAPYSLIHLRNMTTLSEAGAIIMPASPAFYLGAETIDELCLRLSERVVELTGLAISHPRWGDR